MPRMASFTAFAALATLFAGSVPFAAGAFAQTASADDRFAFEQVDEGILRLDGRTGEVSLCGRGETGWVCRSIPDERKALDAEIGRLETENGALKQKLAEMSAEPAPPAATGAIPQTAPKPEPPKSEQPAPEPPAATQGNNGLHHTVAAVDKIWRRLVELMSSLRADLQNKS